MYACTYTVYRYVCIHVYMYVYIPLNDPSWVNPIHTYIVCMYEAASTYI